MPDDSLNVDTDNIEGAPLNIREVSVAFPGSFTYANCAAFSISMQDFRVAFAEAMPDGHAETKVGVVMSPEAAAIITLTLFQLLKNYESQFGEIRHPAWRQAKAKAGIPKPPAATD